MQKYQDTVLDSKGRPVSGATVTVTTLAGAAATIYSDNGSTEITSLTTGSDGSFAFYAEDGRYTITISKTGLTTRTISDVLLEDPTEGGFTQAGTDAVERTVQAKLREFLSFDDFDGVEGDGSNDDTAGMQAALDAAPEGATVRGTAGKTYKFTNLSSTKALTIDFGGADLIVSPGANLTSSLPAVKFESALGTGYAIDTVTTLASDIVCTTAADSDNFAAGDWVIVSDSYSVAGWDEGIGGSTSRSYTGRSEINRVDAVSSGTITLAKAVEHLYDGATATVKKITAPICQPRVLNIGTVTEVDPGGPYVGSFGSAKPDLFAFINCIQPLVSGVALVNGWQLHVVQFSLCASPVVERMTCVAPFRPDSGGHGYVMQFDRCSDGLATKLEGHGARHLVDFTQSYDCVSAYNVAYDPRAAQFFCHGQQARRCKSVDDTVYTNKNTSTGNGWYCGNSAFNADYDYTVVRPTYIGAGGTGAFVASTNSERMTVIDPLVRITKTSTTAFRAFDVNAGAIDTKLIGGVIDLSGASGAATDACLFTRDKTDTSDLVGIKPVNLTVIGTKIIGGTESGMSGVNLTLMSGVVRIQADLVGSALGTNAIRVAADCLLTEFSADECTLSGTWQRGIQTLVAPSGIYSIRRIKSSATFGTGLYALTLSSSLQMDPAPGVSLPGNAGLTATAGTTPESIVYASAIGADRAVTLSTSTVWTGAKFLVTRTAAATGAFNVNVGTGPLKALAAGQWCEVTYTGSAWALTAYGSL